MSELVAFLRARADAREALAKDHGCIHCGHRTIPLRNAFGITGYTHHGDWEGTRCPGSLTGAELVQDPARALRVVAAVRRIMARHHPVTGWGAVYCAGCPRSDMDGDYFIEIDECPELRDLAAIDSDHPDYRKEWAP